MRYSLLSGAAMALVACGMAWTAVGSTSAYALDVGSIHIDQPWSRATPKGATTGAGYLTITNNGSAPDRLVGGTVSVAKALEIHTMSMDNNVMKMRQLKDGIVIKPGETVRLQPQAVHLMFVGLTQPLKQNTTVKGTLTFEKAGTVNVEFSVEGIGGMTSHTSSGGMAH